MATVSPGRYNRHMPSAKRPAKVQRWIDLIAALFRNHFPVSFDELRKDVPAYANRDQADDARMRMFERDKDELRELGVPLESVNVGDGVTMYRLRSREFYLPYLTVVEHGVRSKPPVHPEGLGYKSLPTLAFEPDELAMIARAAHRVQQMQHPALAADAATAMRKLAFDVPLVEGGVREIMLSPFRPQDPAVLDVLDDAVRRRKRVEFSYRSMERDVTSQRTVEPYGLVFLSGLWYLVGRDTDADALRHFRASRISEPKVNHLKVQSTDFALPDDFNLWIHAESHQAWELGDGDATVVTVRFDTATPSGASGAALGAPSKKHRHCREFIVRRPESFVRWLLSFGGAAVPVSPGAVTDAWRALARSTAALYAAEAK